MATTLFAMSALLSSPVYAQSLPNPTYPPLGPSPTLPMSTVGTAALISTGRANTFYGTATTVTDSLQVITQSPTPTPTPPEIIETARALQNNVDLIYAYVRNNIEVSWMYGLQKGALGALIDKYGTPFDQADLMVKLLQQTTYPVSYKIGNISLSGTQFTNWTGISDLNAACQMLANGGFPGTVTDTNNNNYTDTACSSVPANKAIQTVSMAHIWVQVTIAGTNYLFDPSYKPHTKWTGINLTTATGLNGTTLFNDIQAGVTSSQFGSGGTAVPYSYGFNTVGHNGTSGLNNLIQGYAQSLLTYMYSNNLQAAHMEDIVGGGVITPDNTVHRDTSLSYVTSTVTSWTGGVPDQYRTSLAISGYIWDSMAANGCPPATPALGGAWCQLFTGKILTQPLFIDQIYGRRLDVVAGPKGGGDQYSSVTTLQLDGVPYQGGTQLATFTNPGINTGAVTQSGVQIFASAAGLPAFLTLTADHPYAAANDGSTNTTGTYMDQTVTKAAKLYTPLTIVDGFGDTSGALFSKWSDERGGDLGLPPGLYACITPPHDGICGNMYPGNAGDFEREKLAANWLAQSTRAAHLHAAIAGGVVQLHHALGLSFADNFFVPTYLAPGSQQNASPTFLQGDNVNRLDVDSGFSYESSTASPVTPRNAVILSIAATSAAIEGSVEAQQADLPDSSSTATRFEWGNAPPGTPGNWDAPQCSSPNAYEDPGCPGARKFVEYTSSNASQAATIAQIETHPASYYTGNGEANKGDPPAISSNEASVWEGAYNTEVGAYASCGSSCGTPGNVPFSTIITSQETFLGPGQRGGGNIQWLTQPNGNGGLDYISYSHDPTRQRGPALVATAYDASGNPVAIAHDLIGIAGAQYPWPGYFYLATKGGGAGQQADTNLTYSPATAADILKARFVDKSNVMGVNLSNGSMAYTAPAKVDVGNGGFPYELTADLEWNPHGPAAVPRYAQNRMDDELEQFPEHGRQRSRSDGPQRCA